MTSRVLRKASLRQPDRLPLETYEQALWRLVQIRCDASISDDAYYLAVRLIADIFWQTDCRVIRDVRKAAVTIGC